MPQTQPCDSLQVLQNAREELLVKVRQQLETASREGKASDVMRFVALFGPLGAKVGPSLFTYSHGKPSLDQLLCLLG